MKLTSNMASILTLLGLLSFSVQLAGPAHSNSALAQIGATVTVTKLPEAGIQPQAAVDSTGTVHIVYFKGDDRAGNLYYIKRVPNESNFSAPIQVNSQNNTAGAIGTVRVANIAIGKGDSVHISWNGLGPKSANGYPEAYAAYSRLVISERGTTFEPQKNLSTWAKILDGGGSLAADRSGNVYVVWHAMANAKDEAGRAVYVAKSSDNGKTFARETSAATDQSRNGACGCCGLRSFADANGALYIMYRSAKALINRDTMLLVSHDAGKSFTETLLDKWNINTCPMSTYAISGSGNGSTVYAAWETTAKIYFGRVDSSTGTVNRAIRAEGSSQKHPTICTNSRGETLVAWDENTGWQKGGDLAWRVYDAAGRPTGVQGRTTGVPVWGLPTAYVDKKDNFVIVY